MSDLFAVSVFVPQANSSFVRNAIAEHKGGAVGNYDSCSFTSAGIGRY
jgi:hypothetical protein